MIEVVGQGRVDLRERELRVFSGDLFRGQAVSLMIRSDILHADARSRDVRSHIASASLPFLDMSRCRRFHTLILSQRAIRDNAQSAVLSEAYA